MKGWEWGHMSKESAWKVLIIIGYIMGLVTGIIIGKGWVP